MAAAVVVLVAVWIAADRQNRETAGPALPASADIPPRPPGAVPMTMEYAYDGDTLRARAARPSASLPAESVRIRIIGIDTPEGTPTAQCGADEAREHLVALLPEGSRLWGAVEEEPRDRYGRWLLHLWTDDGRFVAGELVAAGHAITLRVPPNVAHAPLLSTLQADAETARRGQWAACR